jgi:MFS family permease
MVRGLVAAIAAIAAFGVSIGLTQPLLSLVLEARGHSSTLIGVNTTVQFLGIMVAAPLIPGLIRRLGVLAVMFAGVAISAATLLAFAGTESLVAWFAIRFILGCAEAALFIAGETWINQVVDDRIRGRVIGAYGTVLASGLALGPLIIGLTGIAGALPFLVGGAIIAAAVMPLAAAVGTAPRISGHPSRGPLALMALVPLAASATAVFGLLDAGVMTLLPLYGTAIGLDAAQAAVLVTVTVVGGVVLQFPIGWLADHVGRTGLLIALAALGAAGMVVVPLLAAVPLMLHGLLFLVGGMVGGLWTVPMVMLGEKFRGVDLATINVATALLYGVGSVIGPSVLGATMELSPHGLMLAMALAPAGLAVAGLAAAAGARRAP